MDMYNNGSGLSEGESDSSIRFEIPYFTFVFIFGTLGNALVIAVYTKPPFRYMNCSCYILNLAVGDLLALTVVLFHITEFFPKTWPILWAHTWQCSVHRYYRFVGFNNTVLTMMAIAIDRYYAVRKPVVFKLKFSLRGTKMTILLLWLLSLVAAIPTAFMFQSVYANEEHKSNYAGKSPFACKLSFPPGRWFPDFKAIYLHVVLFLIPVAITGILFICIFVHVRRNNVSMVKRFDSVPVKFRRSHWKTAKSLLAVFIVFVICYFPFAVYNLFQRYIPNVLPATFSNIALILPYSNSCMNPVVYSFTSERFRAFSCRLLCPFIQMRKRGINKMFSSLNSGNDSPEIKMRMILKQRTAGNSEHSGSQEWSNDGVIRTPPLHTTGLRIETITSQHENSVNDINTHYVLGIQHGTT